MYANKHTNFLVMYSTEAYILDYWNNFWIITFTRVFIVVYFDNNSNLYIIKCQVL